MQRIVIREKEEGQRLDRFLRKYLKAAPLSLIYRLCRKDVKVNGRKASIDRVLRAGDEVLLNLTDERISELARAPKTAKAKRQFTIVYEDDNILICGKPFGLLTHGDSLEKKNTLVNQVLGYLSETPGWDSNGARAFTPSPVNRLDRNTTGIVVFGKNPKAVRDFSNMLRHTGEVDKYYMTIAVGEITAEKTLVSRMVKDETRNRAILLPEDSDEGRRMETFVRPLRMFDGYTLAEVKLITGRPHQIRAHLASIGHPVIGDQKYGNTRVNRRIEKDFGLTTQLLHAYRVVVNEGRESLAYLSGRVFECPVPEQFQQIEQSLCCHPTACDRG